MKLSKIKIFTNSQVHEKRGLENVEYDRYFITKVIFIDFIISKNWIY